MTNLTVVEEAIKRRDRRIRRETLEAISGGIYQGLAQCDDLDPAAKRALLVLADTIKAQADAL